MKRRYRREPKARTTVAVSPDMHELVKYYAHKNDMTVEDAVEQLIKLAIEQEMLEVKGE